MRIHPHGREDNNRTFNRFLDSARIKDSLTTLKVIVEIKEKGKIPFRRSSVTHVNVVTELLSRSTSITLHPELFKP